jgi:hypothetical protein
LDAVLKPVEEIDTPGIGVPDRSTTVPEYEPAKVRTGRSSKACSREIVCRSMRNPWGAGAVASILGQKVRGALTALLVGLGDERM